MRYYISDLHLFHLNVIAMDGRHFKNLEQMHAYIVERWNAIVNKNDDVFVLGDLSMGKGKETAEILRQLKGKITLIKGNHDDRYLSDKEFDYQFRDILSYDERKDNNRNVMLFHYPVPFYNKQFRRNEKGECRTFMLYGHVHNTYDEYLLNRSINDIMTFERQSFGDSVQTTPVSMVNTFCLFSDYRPLTLDQWLEIDGKRRRLINETEQQLGGKIPWPQWMELNEKMTELSQRLWNTD
ncbi:MAG: metallophosphoesterase family protein [Erysipelotrichaceae bacterium]|nr:metallophosphoesterase family protein [Erysipelotrichaceae bacterium]